MHDGRTNQKARTRKAILDAAVQLLGDGKAVTVPDVAERAQVSVATAYRYFPSSDALAEEASLLTILFLLNLDEVTAAVDHAGDDVHGRVEALVRKLGKLMLHNQAPFRTAARVGWDTWFAQQQLPADERVPVREGRRTGMARHALIPLKGKLTDEQMEQLVSALAIAVGTEAAISLTDVAHLEPDPALEVMVTTARWILDGALTDAGIG
ncbi:MAG: helix-turn-helix domain-containing protein [Acidimicrobiales bacterium]